MSLAAGKLRHWIEIQQQSTSKDSHGDAVQVWSTFCYCWAEVAALSAREFLTAQQVNSEVRGRITIRYRPGVTATMRAIHRGRIYEIQGVLPDMVSGIEYLTLPVSQGLVQEEAPVIPSANILYNGANITYNGQGITYNGN